MKTSKNIFMNVLVGIILLVMSCGYVFAEASFDQIQGLIKEKNYSAAVKGLDIIIRNHPRSAKAYYALSQAEAGLGNQTRAKEALDIATGIDPSLKFASSGNVEKLKEAITPQTKNIEAVESHWGRNFLIFLLILSPILGVAWWYKKKQNEVNKKTVSDWFDDKKKVPFEHPEQPENFPPPSYLNPPTTIREGYQPPVLPSSPSYIRTRSSYNPPNNTTTIINNGNDGGSRGSSGLGSFVAGAAAGALADEVFSGRHSTHETPKLSEEVSSWEDKKEKISSSWDEPKEETVSKSWDEPRTVSYTWPDPPEETSPSWDENDENDEN